MITIQIGLNQSLIDLAIRYGGSADYVFVLMRLNNLSLTAELTPGTKLLMDLDQVIDQAVVDYYDSRGIMPAILVATPTTPTTPTYITNELGEILTDENDNQFIL